MLDTTEEHPQERVGPGEGDQPRKPKRPAKSQGQKGSALGNPKVGFPKQGPALSNAQVSVE